MSKQRKTHCPQHGPMVHSSTRYGPLWACEHPGCTVKRWGGSTSMPGDQSTRDARNRLHGLFDPLWEDENGMFSTGERKNKRGVRKDRAYWWLANLLGIERKNAHFGMFNLEQCQRVEEVIRKIASPHPSPANEAGEAKEKSND